MGDDNKVAELNWGLETTIYVGDGSTDYGIYQNRLDAAVDYCNEVAAALRKGYDAKADNEYGTERVNTVVGILGERGSGKSSFLYTLKKALESDSSNGIYALNIVDPTSFQTNMNGLELFLASLFDEVRNMKSDFDKRATVDDYPRLNKKFRDVARTLSNIRRDKDDFRKENPSIEVLGHMADVIDVRDTISELCEEFLAFANKAREGANKRCIALFLDDVDLASNAETIELLQDIRKFLSGSVLVVMAYRERQLIESLESEYLKIDKTLLKYGQIELQNVHQKVLDFLGKIVPANRRIHLFDQADMLDGGILDILSALSADDGVLENELIVKYIKGGHLGFWPEMSVREWLEAVVFAKTRLRVVPFNSNEETSIMWPRNLRELIPFAKLLQVDMAFLDIEPVKYYRAWLNNLNAFDEYFRGKAQRHLDADMTASFTEWYLASYETRNYTAYASMLALLNKSVEVSGRDNAQKYLSDLLEISLVHPENVTLGDVSRIANRLIGLAQGDEVLRFFGYSVKLVYSIELLRLLLQAILCPDEDIYKSRYLALLNACLVTPEKDTTQFSLLLQKPTDKQVMAYMMRNSEIQDIPSELNDDARNLFDQIDVLLNQFGCTTSPSNGEVADASRPKYYKTLRGDYYGIRDALGAYNRNLFPSSRFHSEMVLFESSEGTERWIKGNTYWISALYALSSSEYLSSALDAIISEDKDGAYVFYSLFDLDIFGSMTVMQKKGSYRDFSSQIKRLSSAIWVAYASSRADAESLDRVDNPFLMRINLAHEKESFAKICIPFIEGPAYLLFGSEMMINPSDIDSIFETINHILSTEQTVMIAVRRFMRTESKNLIADYLTVLRDWLARNHVDIDAQAQAEEHLSVVKNKSKYMASDRRSVIEFLNAHPNAAAAAYESYSNEKRG